MARFSSTHIFYAALAILATATPLMAQSGSSAIGSGDRDQTHQRFQALENGSKQRSSTPFKFQFQSSHFGSLSVTFKENPIVQGAATFMSGEGEQKDNSSVLLLKGSGELNGEQIPVAGSVFRSNGKEELHIHFISPSLSASTGTSLRAGEPVEIVQSLDDSSKVVVKKADANALKGKSCGSDKLRTISAPTASSGTSSSDSSTPVSAKAGAVKIIDIATEADYQFFQRFGSSSNAQVASIINAAQVIYENQLGLRFNIVRQRVRTTSSQPYTSTDSEALLNQLTSAVSSGGGLQGEDVVHLFSGKNLDDNVLGIAWLGVLCTTPSLSTGLTQHVSSSLDYIIFAHEVGHNLGAEHDTSLPRSLMYPSASTDQTTVSARTKSDIQSYFNSGGSSCFAVDADTNPTPTPTPTPTTEPRDGDNDNGGGSAGGDGTTDPVVGFSTSFSDRSGKIVVDMTRGNFSSGNCTATLILSSKENLSDGVEIEVDSEATSLRFSARTSRRLTRGSVYLAGTFTNCDGGEEASSWPVELKPKAKRSTRSRDKVSARNWINTVSRSIQVTER